MPSAMNGQTIKTNLLLTKISKPVIFLAFLKEIVCKNSMDKKLYFDLLFQMETFEDSISELTKVTTTIINNNSSAKPAKIRLK